MISQLNPPKVVVTGDHLQLQPTKKSFGSAGTNSWASEFPDGVVYRVVLVFTLILIKPFVSLFTMLILSIA
jgi:hypothetical protein